MQFSAGAFVVANREIERIRSLFRIYQQTLRALRDEWRHSDVQDLRRRFQDVLPEAAIFPIWASIYAARNIPNPDPNYGDFIDRSLESTEEALRRIEQGTATELDPDVIGDISHLLSRYERWTAVTKSAA
jgi:hypothetical protein